MIFNELSEEQRTELWACLAIRHCKGIGAVRGKRLLEAYGSAMKAVDAARTSKYSWAERNIASPVVCSFFASGAWRENAKKEWTALQKLACNFVYLSSPLYPALLKEIPDAPLMLYYKGDFSLLSSPSIGIVGSRSCSMEGIRMAAFLGRGLSFAGVTIISGMAKGIDRAAHLAGLEGAGRSIAVLGTGIDVVYPFCNEDLAELLVCRGLLITEFAPETQPNHKHFPVRNRLISGLSRGVLVVEAAARSGSLITARLALEQNREVFAIPGATTSSVSEGCRELIRRGAKPVFSADDILIELAPLLTLDARVALEKRAEGKLPSDAVKDSDILPQGEIPWLAVETKNNAKKTEAPRNSKIGNAEEKHARATAQILLDKDSEAANKPVEKTVCVEHLSKEEQLLLQGIGNKSVHIDELAFMVGIDVARVSCLLTVLEMQGVVQRQPGMYYTLP